MNKKLIELKTPEGICDTYISFPEGKKNLPIVLLYMDAVGLRQRIYDMADHIAEAGYFVMAPNIFYRTKRVPIADYSILPAGFPEVIKEVIAIAHQHHVDMGKRDVQYYLDFAKAQPNVDSSKIGAVGYCMGGGLAIRAAGNYPEEFKAVASFHAGGLCTDQETSPHRYFPKMKAEVYIGHADHDKSMPAEQITALEEVLKHVNFKNHSILYKDCHHGWTMKDLPAYNAAGEKKHFTDLLALFKRNL
ncbi:dienelactone hydrolase family protein [Bdellovibrio sp. NC01]|uniref:dienelactone hydrolase family protein n=1 Tax=Bdellovibrio sp. NC01 TaxID=2220073 RepID=UPI001157DDB3|nr:dienelactone hydrolase family protein [Bdellovibrio sp. NC01]QDK39326.1 dienelactone hydrolase family protein [Bdellovibrio sp. NC01]